jgi:multiple sugar transport system permease protein
MLKKNALPYKLVAPFVLIEITLVILPLFYGFYYSFFRVDYFKLGRFLGIQNYLTIISSQDIIRAIGVTGVFTLFSVVVTFIFGFMLSLMLQKDRPSTIFVRAVVLIPYTISMLVGSMLIKWIITQDSGIISFFFTPLGIKNISILSDPTLSMAAVIVNAIWRDTAFVVILLIAGLKSIPEELYESARIDGAGAIVQFLSITIPLIKSVIMIILIRLLIHFVNVLTIPLVLTGGAPGGATKTLSLHLYNLGFQTYRFGQANALAILMLFFNLTLISILVFILKERQVVRAKV